MLKRLIGIVSAGALMALTVYSPVSAHRGMGAPFLKIDGVYTLPYPVPTNSVPDFMTAMDLGPTNYRLGETLQFQIDTSRLGTTASIPDGTVLTWDFGDGSVKGQGLSTSHTYNKIGTYEVDITGLAPGSDASQLVEAVLINVIPDFDYKLPTPVLKVNGHPLSDPNSGSISVDMSKPITFDASGSAAGTKKITSYFWDLADTQSSTEGTLTHTYSQYAGEELAPMLRVKDENGFYADTFVWIKNDPAHAVNSSTALSSHVKTSKKTPLWPIVVGAVMIVGLGLYVVLRRKK